MVKWRTWREIGGVDWRHNESAAACLSCAVAVLVLVLVPARAIYAATADLLTLGTQKENFCTNCLCSSGVTAKAQALTGAAMLACN